MRLASIRTRSLRVAASSSFGSGRYIPLLFCGGLVFRDIAEQGSVLSGFEFLRARALEEGLWLGSEVLISVALRRWWNCNILLHDVLVAEVLELLRSWRHDLVGWGDVLLRSSSPLAACFKAALFTDLRLVLEAALQNLAMVLQTLRLFFQRLLVWHLLHWRFDLHVGVAVAEHGRRHCWLCDIGVVRRIGCRMCE